MATLKPIVVPPANWSIKKDKGLKKLENYQCPGCQALNDRNWVFVGEGNSKTFEWK